MRTSDLFSHPEHAEHTADQRVSTGPTKNPEFSDRPEKDEKST